MSNMIPGYKRHPIEEFAPDAKRLRTTDKAINGNGKKTRGRVKIDIEVFWRSFFWRSFFWPTLGLVYERQTKTVHDFFEAQNRTDEEITWTRHIDRKPGESHAGARKI